MSKIVEQDGEVCASQTGFLTEIRMLHSEDASTAAFANKGIETVFI